MTEPLCRACDFWVQMGSGQPVSGRCHRHPPRIIDAAYERNVAERPDDSDLDHIEIATQFPITDADDFCGEFQNAELKRTMPASLRDGHCAKEQAS